MAQVNIIGRSVILHTVDGTENTERDFESRHILVSFRGSPNS